MTASSNGELPIERNRSLLWSLFKFKPNSKLHSFITGKGGNGINLFTLAHILTILKDVIRGEGLYDEKNPSIIMCSPDLEAALNMKALHVTEIRDLVLTHLIRINNDALPDRYCKEQEQPNPNNTPNKPIPTPTTTQRIIHTANISTNVILDKKAKFKCKPKFLLVLQTMPEVDKNRTVFSYEETTLLLSTYILRNKKRFFDTRNIKLAIVKGDLLGDAFGVNAFHRCQVNNLLRGQIIPLDPNNIPHKLVVKQYASPGCAVMIRDNPIKLEDHAAITQSSDTASKRPNPECEEEGLKSKLAKLEDHTSGATPSYGTAKETNINDAQHGNSSDCSSKGRKENESTGEESDYHIHEYEPETCSEDERPTQAGGRQTNKACMSSSGSDSDINENFINANKDKEVKESNELKKESHYWGDTSEDERNLNELSTAMSGLLEHKNNSFCIECREPSEPLLKFCNPCWNKRKDWKGSHTRKSKQGRSTARNVTSEVSPKAHDVQNTQRAAAHLCILCCARTKNAGLVHGRISHQVCCYHCAKKLWRKRSDCPICRRKIEKIVKIIPA